MYHCDSKFCNKIDRCARHFVTFQAIYIYMRDARNMIKDKRYTKNIYIYII